MVCDRAYDVVFLKKGEALLENSLALWVLMLRSMRSVIMQVQAVETVGLTLLTEVRAHCVGVAVCCAVGKKRKGCDGERVRVEWS